VFRSKNKSTRADTVADDEDVRNRLVAIVESSDDAIISKSLQGVIESWNRGAERIFGYTANEAIGKSITILIPEELRSEEDVFLRRLRAGDRIEHYETVRVTKSGERLNISLTISPVRDRRGRIIGASKVARDITARKRAEETLREADRRKDEFLAVLAHELRNPLAPIRNSLHLLRVSDAHSEQAAKARIIIERQVNHMTRLVDDLMEVSRITRGKVDLQREPVDVSAVVLSAIETSRPAIEAGKHQITMSLATEPMVVRGDFVRLGQVIANLLNNAAKYTPSGGQIAITTQSQAGQALISVQDTGSGIEPEMLSRIFDMFVQIDRPGHRAKGGLGIGLALARTLIDLHGGQITAKSDGPDKGSTFEIRLPLSEAGVRRRSPEVPEEWSVAQSPKRVLVVDDNQDAAESMAMMLVSMGHQVRVEHGGEAALEAAKADPPDVVFLDIGMPGMDGLEVVRRLRREPGFAQVRFAALTGFGQPNDIERSRQAGFDEHLVKPVSPDALKIILDGGVGS
jgi:PAS domain S-box-containing protein